VNRELFNPDLSIIIVNWNTRDYLSNCLKSIYETTSRVSIEIFVVDNASTDRSVEMVKNKFPQVKLIANKENLGFPKANNQAIKVSNGEYILFLNPDTVVYPKTIEMLVNFLKANKNCGAVGPMIVDKEGKVDYLGARNFPTLFSAFSDLFFLRKLFPTSRLFGKRHLGWWDHRSSRLVECISGACIMVRSEDLEKIGFLDETLPLYLEDVDLCKQIKNLGRDIYYLASAQIIHFQGASSKRYKNSDRLFVMHRLAYGIFFKRYKGDLTFYLYLVMLFINSLVRIALSFGNRKIFKKNLACLNLMRNLDLIRTEIKDQ